MFRSSLRLSVSLGRLKPFTSSGRQLTSPVTKSFQQHRFAASYKRFNQGSSASTQFTLSQLLRSRATLYIGLGTVGFCLYNLENAPVTNRLRLLWIPFWLEAKIGDYSYRQIMSEYGNQILPTSDPLYRRVSNVMNKLLESAISNTPDQSQREHLKSLPWTIHIIQVDPNKVPPNAFILPNGKIFIFLSILGICGNDDGLATVLSHELSHQLARHTSEQLSKQPFYLALLAIMYMATGVDWLSSVFINGVLKMPASREMEVEADHIGCTLMARLCFNIHESVKFWQRMSDWEAQAEVRSRGGGVAAASLQEFFLTHPGTPRRIANIEKWMPELENIRESSGCYEHQFGLFMDKTRNYFK